MKNFWDQKSVKEAAKHPSRGGPIPNPTDSHSQQLRSGNEHLPCPTSKLHCFTAAGLPSTQTLPHTMLPDIPRIPGLVSLTQKVSMPSDELQGYRRAFS